jgi:ABC-type multidrug transport system fused ATPase/permease subunit
LFRIAQDILSILNKRQKNNFNKIFFLLSLTSVIEFLAIIYIFDIFQYLVGIGSLKSANYFSFLFNIKFDIFNIFFILILIFVLKFFLSLYSSYSRLKYQKDLGVDISTQILRRYLYDDILVVKRKSNSELIRNIELTTGNFVNGVMQHVFTIISEIIIIILVITLLSYLSTKILFFSIFNIIIIALIHYFFFKKKISKIGIEFHETSSQKLRLSTEALNGLLEIRSFQAQEYFLKKYHSSSDNHYKSSFILLFVQQIPRQVIEFSVVFFISLLIIFFFNDLSKTKEIIKILGLFGIASFRLIPSATKILHALQGLKYTESVLREIKEETRQKYFFEKSTQYLSQSKNNFLHKETEQKKVFFQEIVFDNVSFKYPDRDNYIFKNINLKIKKNSKTLVIGGSGHGKTTFLNLLLGFLTPIEGSIYFTDQEKNKIYIDRVSLLNLFGYVPQKSFLLKDSIKNNIAFGLNEKNIDENKINDALYFSGLENFIKTLPYGINTTLDDFASNLSGGQVQRLSIARCFYRGSSVLIFDEPFSSLDSKNENFIVSNVNNFAHNKTLIIISHKKIDSIVFDNTFEIKNSDIILKN